MAVVSFFSGLGASAHVARHLFTASLHSGERGRCSAFPLQAAVDSTDANEMMQRGPRPANPFAIAGGQYLRAARTASSRLAGNRPKANLARQTAPSCRSCGQMHENRSIGRQQKLRGNAWCNSMPHNEPLRLPVNDRRAAFHFPRFPLSRAWPPQFQSV